MADEGSALSTPEWPRPKFSFEVQWDSAVMHFQEVSGLDVETQPIEYRHGDSAQFTPIKMQGLKKFSDVTMKRGVFKSDKNFRDWFNDIKLNTIKRKTIIIRLLDETGAPAMTWTLASAWPNKITGDPLKAEGGEVALETMVISHEGLTIANG
jgi:phage tail-like protein